MSNHRKARTAAAAIAALAALALLSACSPSLPGSAAPGDPTPSGRPTAAPSGPIGAADGAVAEGVPVTTDTPAITNLSPALRQALQGAARAAKAERDIDVLVTSGWRTARYQQSLFDDAVRRYGSTAEAERVVAGTTSEHVAGDAVDIGPTDAADWMTRFGEDYGLCRVYANEMWHFEAKSGAQCAPMVSDASRRSR